MVKQIVEFALQSLLDAPPAHSGPVRHVLIILMNSCSDENRPRVGDALRQLLKRVIDEDPDNELALVAALKLPLRGHGYARSRKAGEYWTGWVRQNQHDFASVIDSHASRSHWVATMHYEAKLMTFTALMKTAGVRSLYDYDVYGEVDGAPLVYRYFLGESKRHRGCTITHPTALWSEGSSDHSGNLTSSDISARITQFMQRPL